MAAAGELLGRIEALGRVPYNFVNSSLPMGNAWPDSEPSRTKILRIWNKFNVPSAVWIWGVDVLLHCAEWQAKKEFQCCSHSGEFLNLDFLSHLAGSDDLDTWFSTQSAPSALLRCWSRYRLIISRLERSHFCLQLKGHLNGDDFFCYSQSSSPWIDHCHSPTIKSAIWMPCARSFFRWRSLMKTTRLVTSTTESL
jgi:hypothetical protein